MAEEFKMTPGWRARSSVWASIGTAYEIGAARAIDPDTWPGVPKQGVAEWLTRKTLADLLNLGFEPEGWQEAFATMPGEDGETPATIDMPPLHLADEGTVSVSGRWTDNGYEIQVHSDMDREHAQVLLRDALEQVQRYGLTEDGE